MGTAGDIGASIHLWLAVTFLFLLPLTTAPKDIAFGLLGIWSIIRLPQNWPSLRRTMATPVLGLLLLWCIWQALSLVWSVDVRGGLKELGTYRMLLLPLMLWPVLHRIPLLIAAFLAGVLVQNLVQAGQALSILHVRSADEGRLRGALHPIQTGAVCLTAMCWYLSAAIRAQQLSWKLPSVAGLMVAGLGLIGTGSRGPWIAAAVAVPLVVAFTAVRRPTHRKGAILLGLTALLFAAAAWPFVHKHVETRINDAMRETQLAREREFYWSSTGLRIGLVKWSIEISRANPIIGIGVGSFQESLRELPEFKSVLEKRPRAESELARDHPHSFYLYVLVCTGWVGAAMLAIVLLAALRQVWRDRDDHVFADGTIAVLIAWLVGTQFDCYNTNGNLMGLFAFVLAITLPNRPVVQGSQRSLDE